MLHTPDVDSGKYKKVVNGINTTKENRVHKERASRNVASTATAVRTNIISRSNHSSGGDHHGSSHRSSWTNISMEVDVALILTVGVKITRNMDAIGTDKTVTA